MEHGAYFKIKAFAWVFVWTGSLIRPASLIENIKKIKITKNARPVDL